MSEEEYPKKGSSLHTEDVLYKPQFMPLMSGNGPKENPYIKDTWYDINAAAVQLPAGLAAIPSPKSSPEAGRRNLFTKPGAEALRWLFIANTDEHEVMFRTRLLEYKIKTDYEEEIVGALDERGFFAKGGVLDEAKEKACE